MSLALGIALCVFFVPVGLFALGSFVVDLYHDFQRLF